MLTYIEEEKVQERIYNLVHKGAMKIISYGTISLCGTYVGLKYKYELVPHLFFVPLEGSE